MTVAAGRRSLPPVASTVHGSRLYLEIFITDRFVAAGPATGLVGVAAVKSGVVAGPLNFREQRDEAFSLGPPVGNCTLNVGVLNNSVGDPNGQDIFDQEAVGEDLSDVSVAGARPRAWCGFQLNGNNTVTGIYQVVWPPGEPIPL